MFTRRNLPHLHFENGIYFITYRLKNSIPKNLLIEIHSNLAKLENSEYERMIKYYDNVLDSGEYGKNYLGIKGIAEICKQSLHYYDGKEYNLICYTIMPNHIHLIFELLKGNRGLSKIMQSIKRYSSRQINIILNREGSFWQDESFDRWIRNEKELYFTINYVLENPVKAGLVDNRYDWEHTYCNKNYLVL